MEIGKETRKQLGDFIANPELIDSSHVDWLKELARRYPSFSAPQILLSYYYYKSDSVLFEKSLSKTALLIGDRKRLFEMTAKRDLLERVLSIEEEIEGITEEELDVQLEEQGSDKLHDAPENVGVASEKKEFDELEKEIITEAVSSTIELEVSEGVGESVSAESSPEPSLDDNPQSYAAWIYNRAKQIHWSEGEGSQDELISEKKSPSDLIDAFIQKDPKISRGKSELFSNEDLAKNSLIEDDAFVTESLAKIYALQGKTEKARKAYKLLSLKYPEKSIYFAAQLKKLGKSNS